MLSIPTILDEFGDDLKESDLNKLLEIVKSGYMGTYLSGNEEGPFIGLNDTNPYNNNTQGTLKSNKSRMV